MRPRLAFPKLPANYCRRPNYLARTIGVGEFLGGQGLGRDVIASAVSKKSWHYLIGGGRGPSHVLDGSVRIDAVLIE